MLNFMLGWPYIMNYVYNNQLDANGTSKMTVSELTAILEVPFAT
jgi:hypothetical protein